MYVCKFCKLNSVGGNNAEIRVFRIRCRRQQQTTHANFHLVVNVAVVVIVK